MRLGFRITVLLGVGLAGMLPLLPRVNDAPKWEVVVVGVTGAWKWTGTMPEPAKRMRDPAKPAPDPCPACLSFGQHWLLDPDAKYCIAGNKGSVVLLFGKDAYSFPCEQTGPPEQACSRPKELQCVRRVAPRRQDWGARLLSAVRPLWAAALPRYVVPVSRGLGPEPVESVISQTGGSLDLGPAFRDMSPGSYRVRLEPLSPASSATNPVQVQWAEGGQARVALQGFRPGLYSLVRLDPNGQPVGPDTWVLVSAAGDFEKQSAAFQQAIDAVQKWPDDVDPRAPRAFLRASLEAISKER